jgi:type I restriction-modification system DNA methylase subunit
MSETEKAITYISDLQTSKPTKLALIFCFYLDALGLIHLDSHKHDLFFYVMNRYPDIVPEKSKTNTLEDFFPVCEFDTIPPEINVFNNNVPEIDDKYKEINWLKVNPEIFGLVYECNTDTKTKKKGGIFYTNKRNILKLIKPLFLTGLWKEFMDSRNDLTKLEKFHTKLSNLKFLDPACGCGNFLVTIYQELKKIERAIIKRTDGNTKLTINQIYGIEIEPVAAQVCVLAMKVTELLEYLVESNTRR